MTTINETRDVRFSAGARIPARDTLMTSAFMFLCAVLLTSGASQAHKHPCGHTHSNSSVVTCNSVGTACTQGTTTGTCKTIQHRTRLTCECVPPPGQGGGGGCLAMGVNSFSDQEDGPPTEGGTFIYLAQGDEGNYFSVNNGDLFGPEFGPKDNAVVGTISLLYGSFADPAAIPVTVEDVSLTLPSVFGSGVTSIALPKGSFQPMIYNSTTGFVDTVDDSGLMLEMTNNFGTEVLPIHLSAELESGGFVVQLQGYSTSLVFPGDFETGDTSRWASLARWFFKAARSVGAVAHVRGTTLPGGPERP